MRHVAQASKLEETSDPLWTDWLAGGGAFLGAIATAAAAYFAWQAASQSAAITMEASRESVVRDALTTQVEAHNKAMVLQDKAKLAGGTLGLSLPGIDPLRPVRLSTAGKELSKLANDAENVKIAALEAKSLKSVSAGRQSLTEIQARVQEIELEVERQADKYMAISAGKFF